MIEPIILTNGQAQYKKLCSENIGGTVFIIEHHGEVHYVSYTSIPDITENRQIAAASGSSNWYLTDRLFRAEICPGIQNWFIVNNNEVSRSKFIDVVKSEYPDHFEWLLFHQEFLL